MKPEAKKPESKKPFVIRPYFTRATWLGRDGKRYEGVVVAAAPSKAKPRKKPLKARPEVESPPATLTAEIMRRPFPHKVETLAEKAACVVMCPDLPEGARIEAQKSFLAECTDAGRDDVAVAFLKAKKTIRDALNGKAWFDSRDFPFLAWLFKNWTACANGGRIILAQTFDRFLIETDSRIKADADALRRAKLGDQYHATLRRVRRVLKSLGVRFGARGRPRKRPAK